MLNHGSYGLVKAASTPRVALPEGAKNSPEMAHYAKNAAQKWLTEKEKEKIKRKRKRKDTYPWFLTAVSTPGLVRQSTTWKMERQG